VPHLLNDFDRGEQALNDWLKRRVMSKQLSGASRTFIAAQSAVNNLDARRMRLTISA